MQTRSLALAVATTLALTASAHSQTRPSEPSPAERLGPQFLFAWSAEDQETVSKALRKLEGQAGIDDILMGRQARILRKIEQGFLFYDQNWTRIQPFILHDTEGNRWSIYQLTLPEVVLTGFAVSRDRYCRAEEQDMEEKLANTYCEQMN